MKYLEATDSNGTELYLFQLEGNCFISIPKEQLEGKWIDKGDYAECSNCGTHSGTQFDGVEPIPLKTKFCPNCRARMKEVDNDKECHKPESEYYRAYCEERKEKTYCEGCEFWY